jgi:hypothetical protein
MAIYSKNFLEYEPMYVSYTLWIHASDLTFFN